MTGFGVHDRSMTNDTATPDQLTAFGLAAADPRPAMTRALAVAATAMDRVADDAFDQPTPCEGMDVRHLMAHLVMVVQRVACAGRADPPATWPTEPTDLADDRLADAFRAEIPAAVGAWADEAELHQRRDLPWGSFTGIEVLGTYVNEVVVHTWDLAQATAQHTTWDDETLAVAHAAIVGQLPMADRDEYWAGVAAGLPAGVPWADPFASAVPVADDASAIDRLVAWNGRRP